MSIQSKILSKIKSRCSDENHKYFKKGIKNFLTLDDINFLWDRDGAEKMEKPSIDRKDSSKNYTLKNCRFIEFRKNCALKNNNKITFEKAEQIRDRFNNGEDTDSLSKEFGISRSFVYDILDNNWYRPDTYGKKNKRGIRNKKELKIGDNVKWTSQALGSIKEKTGTVVSIVEENTPVNLPVIPLIDNGYSISKMKLSYLDKLKRNHKSYLISVRRYLYWPNVKNLKRLRSHDD